MPIDQSYWNDDENFKLGAPAYGYIYPEGFDEVTPRIAFVTNRELFAQESGSSKLRAWADDGFRGPCLFGRLIWMLGEEPQ